MKFIFKLSLASLCAVASIAHAAIPGTYLGAGVGTVSSGVGQGGKKISGTVSGRTFIGYNLNQYFGIEAGLARYGSTKSNFSFNHMRSYIDHHVNAIDVVGKLYLPVSTRFNLYGLGGVARVNVHNTFKNVPVDSIATSGSSNANVYRPIYGLGASYSIPTTQLTTSVEWSRIQGKGSSTSLTGIPSTNMVTLNLAYNFG